MEQQKLVKKNNTLLQIPLKKLYSNIFNETTLIFFNSIKQITINEIK